MTEIITYLIITNAVCRTPLATQGLLNKTIFKEFLTSVMMSLLNREKEVKDYLHLGNF